MKQQTILVAGAILGLTLAIAVWATRLNSADRADDAKAQEIGYLDAGQSRRMGRIINRSVLNDPLTEQQWNDLKDFLNSPAKPLAKTGVIISLGSLKGLDQQSRALELCKKFADDAYLGQFVQHLMDWYAMYSPSTYPVYLTSSDPVIRRLAEGSKAKARRLHN